MRTHLLIASLVVTLLGCASERPQRPAVLAEQCDQLYQTYVDSGEDEARRSLQQVIQIIEAATLRPEATAHGLWLGYGRLFVLEERTGRVDAAQVALMKARFWCLRKAELSGDSSAEAVAYVERFASKDGLMTFVDKWDKDHTSGRGARYFQKR